jgi:hypothetical protein
VTNRKTGAGRVKFGSVILVTRCEVALASTGVPALDSRTETAGITYGPYLLCAVCRV